MSYATDAKLCYGFPVIKDECGEGCPIFNGDIEEWWKQEKGFKHTIEIYKTNAEYYTWRHQHPDDNIMDGRFKNGITEKMKDQYHQEWQRWHAANPLPFELVEHCSSVCLMYILALPGTEICANRGKPVEVPQQLPDMSNRTQEADAIRHFCTRYNVSIGKLGWWLCSFQEVPTGGR